MRKRVRQTATLTLALGMAMTGSMTGYVAVDPAVVETDIVSNVGEMKTELVGTIEITNLSVSLPLKAGLNIDPSKYDGKSINAQIRSNQSVNYKIINDSAVPVYVYISGIEADKDHMGSKSAGVKDTFLIGKTDDTPTLNSAMFAIKDASTTTADGLPVNADTDESFWLTIANTTINSNKYYLNNAKGKMEAKTGSIGMELNLKIYGLTQNG